MKHDFHVYECTDCVLAFAVEQAYDNHSDVRCPVCFNENIEDVCSGSMTVSTKVSEPIKETTLTYCGECQRDFEPKEIVWFTWLENRSFCVRCFRNLCSNIKDWEPRKVPEKEGDTNGWLDR